MAHARELVEEDPSGNRSMLLGTQGGGDWPFGLSRKVWYADEIIFNSLQGVAKQPAQQTSSQPEKKKKKLPKKTGKKCGQRLDYKPNKIIISFTNSSEI